MGVIIFILNHGPQINSSRYSHLFFALNWVI